MAVLLFGMSLWSAFLLGTGAAAPGVHLTVAMFKARPVCRVSWSTARVRFVARCHGDVERVDLDAAEATRLVWTEAFAEPRLLAR